MSAGSRTGTTLYMRERARLLRRAKKNGEPCWLCGRPIDFSAPANTPHAFEADHAIAAADGGSDRIENLRSAHHLCNRRRGRGTATVAAQTTPHGFRGHDGSWNPTTRDWLSDPAQPEPLATTPNEILRVHTTRGPIDLTHEGEPAP